MKNDSRLDGRARAQDDGVGDEAVLVLLDLPDHCGLDLRGVVVMDDTETSKELKSEAKRRKQGKKREG